MREAIFITVLLLMIVACTPQPAPEPKDVATIRGAPIANNQNADDNAIAPTPAVSSQPSSPVSTPVQTSSPFTGKRLAGTTTSYLEFSQADYETALKTKRVIVLDFYANWCPICKREEPEILATFEQLDDPTIIGFRVNYKDSETDDSEEALARRFGVAYQHTKVILVDGNQALKSPESWDTERWLAEIKQVTNG